MARPEAEAGRDFGLARLAAAEDGASFHELGAGRAVNGAVDAAPAEQCSVGGVDDGVDVERGDVALDDGDAVKHRALDAGSRRRSRGLARSAARYSVADADEPSAEVGLTDLIQAMIFHTSSSDLTIPPKGGIGPTTFSDPLR